MRKLTLTVADSEVHESNNSGTFTIIKRDGCERVTVQFIETGYTAVTTSQNAKNGSVRDPFYPRAFGVGFFGVGTYKSNFKGKTTKIYRSWSSMLDRCYNEVQHLRNPSYKGCTVCDEWHNFQVFAEWFELNYIEGYHLDKDIKVKGNKVYSPDYCSYVSQQKNNEQAHCKAVKLLSPEGYIVDVFNISRFARDNGLSQAHLSSVLSGKRNKHKGWTIPA